MDSFWFNGLIVDVPSSIVDISNLIDNILSSEIMHTISFINPEIIIEANKNILLRSYLEKTSYNFVDGNGILSAINHVSRNIQYTFKNRFPGTDFFMYIPADRVIKLFLYGASKENIELASKKIENEYKNVKVVGHVDGYKRVSDEEMVKEINATSPDILIVCLGCPKQELWIMKNIDKINVKLVFGNGGSIDFWSGNVKRASDFFIRHQIEWMYRLIVDFNLKRIRRQLKLIPFAFKSIFKYWEIEPVDRNV